MEKQLMEDVVALNRVKRKQKLWYRVFLSVAVLVVFFTTYILIIPAITMERGDSTADVETQADWNASVAAARLNGNYNNDLVEIAKTQIGYTQSEKNFIYDENGNSHFYSRYGAWNGDEYGEWSVSFVSFCLYFAGITEVGYADTSSDWAAMLSQSSQELYRGSDYLPKSGDIVFIVSSEAYSDGAAGIVESVNESGSEMVVIMQSSEKTVSEQTLATNDSSIIGYGVLPKITNEPVSLSATTDSGLTVALKDSAESVSGASEDLELKVTEEVFDGNAFNASDTSEEDDEDITDDKETEESPNVSIEINQTIEAFEKEHEDDNLVPGSVKAVDIEIIQDDEPVELNGEVEIKIQDDKLIDDSLSVYRVSSDNEPELINVEQEDSEISFATESLDDTYVLIQAQAPPLRAPYNAPGTVDTVDSRSDGITLNLFDYYGQGLDNSRNTVLFPIYNGINRVKTTSGQNYLLFLGCGDNWDRVYPTNGINCFTGGTTAMQGIVNNTLSNGYPTLRTNNSSLDYLFNLETLSDSNAKKVYADVNHLFQKDSDGYYWYDSDQNYAYYNEDSKDFLVYNGTYNNSDGSKIGFFPFNEYDTRYTNVKNTDTNQHYNHHFGLTMSSDFTIPKDKKVNGKDMVFEFSGDDDVWVFIDDVLVLDIGGIHEKVSGSINFTTGAVSVSGSKAASSAGSQGVIGNNSTLEEIFRKAGKTYDGSEGSEHKISFFYMERGGCYSNCSLKFNLCVYNKRSIEIEKNVSGENAANFKDTEFDFQLYLENIIGSDSFDLYRGPATYSDGTPVTFASDGSFKLKAGQKIIVPDLMNIKKYYVRELNVDSRDFATFKVNGDFVQSQEMEDNSQYLEVISNIYKPLDNVEVIYDNELREGRVPLVVEKQWSDGNSAHQNDKITFNLLKNGEKVTYNNTDTFELSAQNNWRMRFENVVIESGDETYEYSVSELEIEGYTPTYETRMIQGILTITINNDKLPEQPKITVEKKWLTHSGDEFEMNGVQGIQVQLWRKYYKPGESGEAKGHKVSFTVNVNDGSNVTLQTLSEITVAENSKVTFIAPLWYGGNPSGAYIGNTPVQVEGTYNDTSNGQVALYAINNVSKDTQVLLKYSQASSDGWIWSGNYNGLQDNFKVISYTNPQPGEPTEGEWIDEMIEEVTLNKSSQWKHEWGNSQVPSVNEQGYDCFYYIKELDLPDYTVEYVNNDGIQEGFITVKNTADFEVILPETGGNGKFIYTLGGLLLIAGSIMYGCILRRKKGRRNR